MMSKFAPSMLIPTPFVRAGLSISHIMFADDLIVFSKSTPLVAANLCAFLSQFSRFSGLGVNWAKSYIFFL